MVKTPRTSDDIFIWIRRQYTTKYKIFLDGTEYSMGDQILSARFTKTVNPEVGVFEVTLDNNNGEFNGVFVGDEEVEFQYDFGSGTTRRFLGIVEEPLDGFGKSGATIRVVGSHVSGELLNVIVTASYDGSLSGDGVINDLMSKFAPSGWTTNNVKSCGLFPVVSFDAVPLWKALSDVAFDCNFDLYGDDSRDLHFFQKGSINNDDEAIVFDDTLINMPRLGKDVLDLKSKVQVYGEDNEGLPVIFTANDASQTKVKETAIFDSSVRDSGEAESLANNRLELFKTNEDVGSGLSWMLPTLSPGDSVYLSNPLQNILGRQRVVRFTHKVPEEFTEFEIEETRGMDNLFRERIGKEVKIQKVTNPFNLNFTYNFTFDNFDNFDSAASDPNVTIKEGSLVLSSGSSGTFVSKARVTSDDVSQVHVKAIGDSLANVTWEVSADNGVNFQSVTLEELENINITGKNLRLRVTLNNSDVRIGSVAILYK